MQSGYSQRDEIRAGAVNPFRPRFVGDQNIERLLALIGVIGRLFDPVVRRWLVASHQILRPFKP